MKISLGFFLIILLATPVVVAHEQYDANGQPVTDHQHVWRQQSYGQDYRQGHAVNNPQGNIVIWSPQTYQGYSAGSTVRFVRPQAITRPPGSQGQTQSIKSTPKRNYGKETRRDYGQ